LEITGHRQANADILQKSPLFAIVRRESPEVDKILPRRGMHVPIILVQSTVIFTMLDQTKTARAKTAF
jgi:hypothetical protein